MLYALQHIKETNIHTALQHIKETNIHKILIICEKIVGLDAKGDFRGITILRESDRSILFFESSKAEHIFHSLRKRVQTYKQAVETLKHLN